MRIIWISIFCILSSVSFAERHDVTGDVGDIRYHNSLGTLNPPWNGAIWFQLINPTENNFCTNNKVSIEATNEIAVSMLLAAKMAGNQVQVTVDDAVEFPVGRYCKLQYLTIK